MHIPVQTPAEPAGQAHQRAARSAQTRPAFEDKRQITAQLTTLQAMLGNSPPQQKLQAVQAAMSGGGQAKKTRSPQARMADARPNHTGLPEHLKAGMESLSGLSLDHVRVHYGSARPARLNAHAYAQGAEIHIAPGQEKHLPHEAWHVVQQAQGRVRPTVQMKGGVALNDDAALEAEADAMGAKALAPVRQKPAELAGLAPMIAPAPAQARSTLQRKSGPVVQRFESADAAQVWIDAELGEYMLTPSRASRMQGPIADFMDDIASWREYGDEAWQAGVTESKEKLKKNYSRTIKLENVENQIANRLTLLTATNAPLKALAPDMADNSWLSSYATPQQKIEMAAIHHDVDTSATSRDAYIARLGQVLRSVQDMTNVSANVDPFIEEIKQEIALIVAIIPHNAVLKNEGDALLATLTTDAGTNIRALLQGASGDPAKQLDVAAGQFAEIADGFIAAKLGRVQVAARITAALALQHRPAKDIWLRKVLKLTPGLGGAYLQDNTGMIGGYPTHATRYADAISANPSVAATSAALKTDVLGSGVTGYHCTIETPLISANQPHAYRGGPTLLRWPQNSAYFLPGMNYAAVEADLNAIVGGRVATAEGRLDAARGNKGADLQRGAVKDKLTQG